MVRFGLVLVAVGLMASVWIAFRFYLALVVDATSNDPVWGFLMASGFCVGVAVAVARAVIVSGRTWNMDPTGLRSNRIRARLWPTEDIPRAAGNFDPAYSGFLLNCSSRAEIGDADVSCLGPGSPSPDPHRPRRG